MKYGAEDMRNDWKSFRKEHISSEIDQLKNLLDIKFEKTGEEIKNRKKYHNIRMSIEGDKKLMNNIKEVEYILHKTFRNPFVKSYNRESNFSKKIKIWGLFTVKANVHLLNGSIIELSRFITF